MGHNGCLMFCQITADEERRVSLLPLCVQRQHLLMIFTKPIIGRHGITFLSEKSLRHINVMVTKYSYMYLCVMKCVWNQVMFMKHMKRTFKRDLSKNQ
jgi:hypothetical protein